MLKICCRISPENEDTITTLLENYGLSSCDNADILLVEEGLQTSGKEQKDSNLVIIFKPEELNTLENFLSGLRGSSGIRSSILFGSRHNTLEPIILSDILYFRAEGNYVYGVTATTEYEVKYKLYELEHRLGDRYFIRVGKSFIVNIMQVQEIIPWFGSRLLLRINNTGQRIEVSRKYIKSFKRYLETE